MAEAMLPLHGGSVILYACRYCMSLSFIEPLRTMGGKDLSACNEEGEDLLAADGNRRKRAFMAVSEKLFPEAAQPAPMARSHPRACGRGHDAGKSSELGRTVWPCSIAMPRMERGVHGMLRESEEARWRYEPVYVSYIDFVLVPRKEGWLGSRSPKNFVECRIGISFDAMM